MAKPNDGRLGHRDRDVGVRLIQQTLDDRGQRMLSRLAGIYTFLILANVGVGVWALFTFRHQPVMLGTAPLAYSFGLRHAVDPTTSLPSTTSPPSWCKRASAQSASASGSQPRDNFDGTRMTTDRTMLIAILGVAISVMSFTVSVVVLWFTWLRRGRLSMTKPTLISFAYDTKPRLTAKVFLRTLLYSTSARGQVIEAMYVKLCKGRSEQTFSFWGYGETGHITPGSGLFVGLTGVALNHHFVLSGQQPDYEFRPGDYSVQVFARLVGRSKPIQLDEISLTLSKNDAGALAGKLGVLFELGWDTGRYAAHAREYTPLLHDDKST